MQLERLKEIIESVVDEKLAERTFACKNSDCIENCGVSRHEHRAHHELVAEIRKDRDSLIEKMKFVHKLMKGKEATTKIVGETMLKLIVTAVVSGMAAGIVSYFVSNLSIKGDVNNESVRPGISSGPKRSAP